jgi:hypothetical protein
VVAAGQETSLDVFDHAITDAPVGKQTRSSQ